MNGCSQTGLNGCCSGYYQNTQGYGKDQALKTIIIPPTNMFFLLAMTMWNPTHDSGAGNLTFTIQWTDPQAGPQSQTATIDLASPSSSSTITPAPMWVLAGTPVQISFLGGTPYGAATYSYLLTLMGMGPFKKARRQQYRR